MGGPSDAVCRQWRAIQLDHRRRYATCPPPMLNLPWLLRECKLGVQESSSEEEEEVETLSFYSPFEDRFYRIPIRHRIRPIKPYWQSLSHGGWLLRSDAIVNPISRIRIPFPKPLDGGLSPLEVRRRSFLPIGDPAPPLETAAAPTLEKGQSIDTAVAFSGRLYCVFCPRWRHKYVPEQHFIVLDPMRTPLAFHVYSMMDSADVLREEEMRGLLSQELHWTMDVWLVELEGEVVLVREIQNWKDNTTVGFILLKPDLSKRTSNRDPSERRWTRVESLGGLLLLLHGTSVVALSAADVGLRGNCIYFSGTSTNLDEEAPWKVFDVGTGTQTEVPFPNASLVEKHAQHLFMPSLH